MSLTGNNTEEEFDFFAVTYGPHLPPPLFRLTADQMIDILREKSKPCSVVYRIEKLGWGPYRDADKWRVTNHCPATGKPSPNSDEGFSELFQHIEKDGFIRRCWFDHFKNLL